MSGPGGRRHYSAYSTRDYEEYREPRTSYQDPYWSDATCRVAERDQEADFLVRQTTHVFYQRRRSRPSPSRWQFWEDSNSGYPGRENDGVGVADYGASNPTPYETAQTRQYVDDYPMTSATREPSRYRGRPHVDDEHYLRPGGILDSRGRFETIRIELPIRSKSRGRQEPSHLNPHGRGRSLYREPPPRTRHSRPSSQNAFTDDVYGRHHVDHSYGDPHEGTDHYRRYGEFDPDTRGRARGRSVDPGMKESESREFRKVASWLNDIPAPAHHKDEMSGRFAGQNRDDLESRQTKQREKSVRRHKSHSRPRGRRESKHSRDRSPEKSSSTPKVLGWPTPYNKQQQQQQYWSRRRQSRPSEGYEPSGGESPGGAEWSGNTVNLPRDGSPGTAEYVEIRGPDSVWEPPSEVWGGMGTAAAATAEAQARAWTQVRTQIPTQSRSRPGRHGGGQASPSPSPSSSKKKKKKKKKVEKRDTKGTSRRRSVSGRRPYVEEYDGWIWR